MTSGPARHAPAVDAAPYRAAIAAGCGIVMLSWAVYPALDATAPAGLSAAVVRGALRAAARVPRGDDHRCARGGRARGFGDAGARAVLAAQAGIDLILCSARDVGQGQATVALAAALQHHSLDPGQLGGALLRVLALRDRLGLVPGAVS